jgi:hypothetical protein
MLSGVAPQRARCMVKPQLSSDLLSALQPCPDQIVLTLEPVAPFCSNPDLFLLLCGEPLTVGC